MIEIAKLLKAHGIAGNVKMQLFSDQWDAFIARGFAYLRKDGDYHRISYTVVRVEPPFAYLCIEGVRTRNDAERLQGELLYLKRSELEPPDAGEYYVRDLIGLKVTDDQGAPLGVLKEVLQHGAADVYVVSGARGFMFPALKRVLRRVDIDAGVMEVDAQALTEVAVYDDL